MFAGIFLTAESCRAKQRKENTVGLFGDSFLGYSEKGYLENCNIEPLTDCKDPDPDQEKFIKLCHSFGHTEYRCSCQKYLCSGNPKPLVEEKPKTETFTGYDLKGKKRTCKSPDSNQVCSMSIEPSDEFSFDCKNQGLKSFKCGCHDYLCSEMPQ